MSVLRALDLMAKRVAPHEIQLRTTRMIMMKGHHNIDVTRESTSGIRNTDKAIKSRYCLLLPSNLPANDLHPTIAHKRFSHRRFAIPSFGPSSVTYYPWRVLFLVRLS
jgi:hypothetical protein